MQFDVENTKKFFIHPIAQEYFGYLNQRGVWGCEYINALKSGEYGYLQENVIFIQNRPYCVDCVLGCSTESICDLVGTNNLYGIRPEKGTVFAVCAGDDYLFFKPHDKRVYFYDKSSDEECCIADDYLDFQNKIIYGEI